MTRRYRRKNQLKKAPPARLKKLTPLQGAYLQLRQIGIPPKKAYLLACEQTDHQPAKYIPQAASQIESKIKQYTITTDDMLQRGHSAARKILDDFNANAETAHTPAVIRIIEMQQDRIDPAIKRIQSETHTVHSIHPEIMLELKKIMQSALRSADDWQRQSAQLIDGRALREITNGKL